MIIRRDQPLANDLPSPPSTLSPLPGSRFNLADFSRTICFLFISRDEQWLLIVTVFTLFCVCLHFVFLRSPTVCVASGDLKPHSHRWASFAFAVSRGVEPSALHCAADGFFLRACELVTISQLRRKFPRAEKVLFNTAPSFLTLTWPPCENRGRQFLTPRLKLVHTESLGQCVK